MMRASAIRTVCFLRQSRSSTRRLFSADAGRVGGATAASTSDRVLVVSRRKFQKHHLPGKATKPKPAEDDKPWPMWSKVVAGAVVSTAVPYMCLWFITSNPTLRELPVVQKWLPLEKLRRHFGVHNPHVLPYPEAVELGRNDTSETLLEAYEFPREASLAERTQQSRIDELGRTDVAVTIMTENGTVLEKRLPGNVPASSASLLGSTGTENDVKHISLDFQDSIDHDEPSGSSMFDGDDGSGMDDAAASSAVFGSDSDASSRAGIDELVKMTQISSPWQYQHADAGKAQQTQGVSGSRKPSDMDIDISRLEYTIAQLQQDLKDPTCTRSIDDMVQDLNAAKRELRNLRWKKRLGRLASTITG